MIYIFDLVTPEVDRSCPCLRRRFVAVCIEIGSFVFTARRVCIAQTMPWQDVCLSVCRTHAAIVSKRLHISSKFFHRWVAPAFKFFYTKRDGNIPTGIPLRGASNAKGYDKNHDIPPISRFISEMMQDRAIVTSGVNKTFFPQDQDQDQVFESQDQDKTKTSKIFPSQDQDQDQDFVTSLDSHHS